MRRFFCCFPHYLAVYCYCTTEPVSYTHLDRVNYAVESSALNISPRRDAVTLCLTIDTNICAVMDYFEIFLTRMLLCRRAAEFLGLKFKLLINDVTLL